MGREGGGRSAPPLLLGLAGRLDTSWTLLKHFLVHTSLDSLGAEAASCGGDGPRPAPATAPAPPTSSPPPQLNQIPSSAAAVA